MASNEPSAALCSECVIAKWTELNRAESTDSICVASGDLLGGLEVTPLVLCPRTWLIIDNHSPFYSEIGYKVTQMYRNSAHLLSIGSVDPQLLRRDMHLTLISEVGGILL